MELTVTNGVNGTAGMMSGHLLMQKLRKAAKHISYQMKIAPFL